MVVSPAGAADLGPSAGISDDGGAIAFLGAVAGVAGIRAHIDGVLETVAAPVNSRVPALTLDPFQSWKDSNGDDQISGLGGNDVFYAGGDVRARRMYRRMESKMEACFMSGRSQCRMPYSAANMSATSGRSRMLA